MTYEGAAEDIEASPISFQPELASDSQLNGQRIGLSLKDFKKIRTLGVGAFGRVLLVQHIATRSYYALKKLKKVDVIKLKQVEHTNAECKLLAAVRGFPFIVQMYCTFQDPAFLYLLMEYIPGGELFSLLSKAKTLPMYVAKFYAAQILTTIEFLHHNDISMITAQTINLIQYIEI